MKEQAVEAQKVAQGGTALFHVRSCGRRLHNKLLFLREVPKVSFRDLDAAVAEALLQAID